MFLFIVNIFQSTMLKSLVIAKAIPMFFAL